MEPKARGTGGRPQPCSPPAPGDNVQTWSDATTQGPNGQIRRALAALVRHGACRWTVCSRARVYECWRAICAMGCRLMVMGLWPIPLREASH